MRSRSAALYAIFIGYTAVGGDHPVAAVTMEECSAKYQAANSETGRIINWNQFRKNNCGPGAVAARSSATAASAALTMKDMQECSAKYQAAKSSGTLGGLTWQQFRKDNCGTPAGNAATTAPKAARPMGFNPGPGPVFPQTVSPKYANEPAGRARLHTCLDQYRANKQTNGNAGLRWIAKGGGYYSECNKRLKG